MPGDVLILGAKGRFGRAALDAFVSAGWTVRAFARSWAADDAQPGVQTVSGDAMDPTAVTAVAEGCDVIVNALNPPYPKWKAVLPRFTETVIAAAEASGATVMIPGNVYNFGTKMPDVLREDYPRRPDTRKGRLREELEEAYAEAADRGVQTIILRAGDFLEREKTGNWFDTYIAPKAARGKVVYPGPLDRIHAWAYLPDLARAMAQLAEERHRLADFQTIGFEGYSLTGGELVSAMERIIGRKLKTTSLPWPMIRLLGLVSPMLREVAEMAYLWRTPHRIDPAGLDAILPGFQPTPLHIALTDALADQLAEAPAPASAALEAQSFG